jgi:hypothetical protein
MQDTIFLMLVAPMINFSTLITIFVLVLIAPFAFVALTKLIKPLMRTLNSTTPNCPDKGLCKKDTEPQNEAPEDSAPSSPEVEEVESDESSSEQNEQDKQDKQD